MGFPPIYRQFYMSQMNLSFSQARSHQGTIFNNAYAYHNSAFGIQLLSH